MSRFTRMDFYQYQQSLAGGGAYAVSCGSLSVIRWYRLRAGICLYSYRSMTLRFPLGWGWCLAIRVSTPPQQDLPLVVYYKYWEKHHLFLRLFLRVEW
jgi:hypothetical protein